MMFACRAGFTCMPACSIACFRQCMCVRACKRACLCACLFLCTCAIVLRMLRNVCTHAFAPGCEQSSPFVVHARQGFPRRGPYLGIGKRICLEASARLYLAGNLEAAVEHECQVCHYNIIETYRDGGPKLSQDIAQGIRPKTLVGLCCSSSNS